MRRARTFRTLRDTVSAGECGSRITRCGDPNSKVRKEPYPRFTPQQGFPLSVSNDLSIWFIEGPNANLTPLHALGKTTYTKFLAWFDVAHVERLPAVSDPTIAERAAHELTDDDKFTGAKGDQNFQLIALKPRTLSRQELHGVVRVPRRALETN